MFAVSVGRVPKEMLVSLLLDIAKLLDNYTDRGRGTDLLTGGRTRGVDRGLPVGSTKCALILTRDDNAAMGVAVVDRTNTRAARAPSTFLADCRQRVYTSPAIGLVVARKVGCDVAVGSAHANGRCRQGLSHAAYKVIGTWHQMSVG